MKLVNAFMTFAMSMTLTVPMHAWATGDGPGNGGGGGGICVGGRCIGLAEAGFRLPDQKRFEIDPDTYAQIEQISKAFPQFDLSTSSVIGGESTITTVEVGEAAKAKKFLDNYKVMLTKHGQAALAQETVLLAFTTNHKTYLINERYQALRSPMSRALLLIHETSIRRGATQEQAVRFDGALIDALKALADHKPIDQWRLISAAGEARATSKSQALLLGQLVKQAGGFVKGSTIFGSTLGFAQIASTDSGSSLTLTYDQLMKARAVNPSAATDLHAGGLILSNRILQRGNVLNDFLGKIQDRLEDSRAKSIVVTNADFDSYVANQNPETRALLASCGSVTDDSLYFRSTGAMTEPAPVSCAVRIETPNGTIEPDAAFNRLNGAHLNLAKPLRCYVAENTNYLSCD